MKRFVACVWTPPSHDKATYERNRIRRREVDSSTQKRLPPGRYLFSSPQSPNGSVDKFLAHHLSVRPLLNGYLAHVERTPLGMIGIDAVNDERLVAGNHVAVANVGPHRFDLRKKLLLESATSCLANSRSSAFPPTTLAIKSSTAALGACALIRTS